MYSPPKFKVEDDAVIRSFIEEHPFGLLLSVEGERIHDTHTPFVFSEKRELLGHIAKGQSTMEGMGRGSRVKVIFTGPHAYIFPQYYVSEFAVPTWNYTAVSISGSIKIIEQEDEVLRFSRSVGGGE